VFNAVRLGKASVPCCLAVKISNRCAKRKPAA
jgi:hypothetical protein